MTDRINPRQGSRLRGDDLVTPYDGPRGKTLTIASIDTRIPIRSGGKRPTNRGYAFL